MSLWNPHAFTPLGAPVAPQSPPALRVLGGEPATAQHLARAQAAFYRFCSNARLSSVPNPVEQGRLADGTPYRIVVVGPQAYMEIWPGRTADDGWLGSGVGVVVRSGSSRNLFLLTYRKGAWRVTTPKEYFGGDGLWMPSTKRPYYLTFNKAQTHAGYFTTDLNAPLPSTVTETSSKSRAVAYDQGAAISGAAVVGGKYVGVGAPEQSGNFVTLSVYRTDAVPAREIAQTPFVPAAIATSVATSSISIGGSSEDLIRPPLSVGPTISADGATAEWAFVDRANELPYADGLATRYPVTKVLTAALPTGALSVRSVEVQKSSSGSARINFSASPSSSNALMARSTWEGYNDSLDIRPPLSSIQYATGAITLRGTADLLVTHEGTTERKATAFVGPGPSGAAVSFQTRYAGTHKRETEIDGAVGGGALGGQNSTAVGHAFYTSSAHPGVWVPLTGSPGAMIRGVEYDNLGLVPPLSDGMASVGSYALYWEGGAPPPPSRDTVRREKCESKVRHALTTPWGNVDLMVLDLRAHIVTRIPAQQDDVTEVTSQVFLDHQLREVLHVISELGVIAYYEAGLTDPISYSGPPLSGLNGIPYVAQKSFVVECQGKEIFRSAVAQKTGGLWYGTGIRYGAGSGASFQPGEFQEGWTGISATLNIKSARIKLTEGASGEYYYANMGLSDQRQTVSFQVLVSVNGQKSVEPPELPPIGIDLNVTIADYSLAHAIDPNSGGGVVMLFTGRSHSLEARTPIAGWAVSPDGKATPLADLLSSFDGNPLEPTAKVEAVISV